MNFPLYIAKRYLFSKSSNNTINIITLIATVGVIVGTLALFIVLSGFSGLREFSVGFLNVSDPDIKITSEKGKSFLFTNEIEVAINNQKGIAFYSKVIEERAFFDFNNKTHIAYIKGVDANYTQVNSIDTTVFIGTWLDEQIPSGVVVGNRISNTLSLGVFDFLEPLKIYVPKPGKGYITNPNKAFNQINTQPIGIFGLTDEIDRKFVFISLQLAQELLSYKPEQLSAIEIKVENSSDRAAVISDLESKLGSAFKIETREQLNAVFYKMLNTENLASYLIFTLILIIALFNVIGAIIMMILDKRDNLKTLYSLGATIKDIKRVFILQGFLLSVLGLIIGLSTGIILVILQKEYQLFMITQNLAYPVEFTFYNVFSVAITILILGFLASKIASSRISKKLVE
ncbi:lipoprotein-releasing system permease protein [Lutibacter agarilyticus]|uniref:Lipoprotein-releasing system permease protein n=1 Tax=Lutibacter agarilyticus TaxID=1109740 RepID=A0A238XBL3_9FLAO|nr:FtsX-like permease family protein [Lutibacter agarilyticus]SNR56347.1 lipoprotein-releasing system permease protein [Lutibacter agarilyticus]